MPHKKKTLAPGLTVKDELKAQALSPFELKNTLIKYAQTTSQKKGIPYLNAGRGNPNFFNIPVRLALCKLTQFAIHISGIYKGNKNVGLRPDPPGDHSHLYNTFKKYFKNDDSEEAIFLKEAVDMACKKFGCDANDLIYELTDGARGDFYPGGPGQLIPPRILQNTQVIVNQYLKQVLLSEANYDSPGQFDLFATEGATAGMVYVFKSLMENFILQKMDKVAVITPVFSPYLEIPNLDDFQFDLVPINASEDDKWQVPDAEIDKLRDPEIKALYLINPTNPTSVAISSDTINKIAQVVMDNKDLIILVDAVYATFVDSFQSIIDKMPYNCITVYSFSKYFGVTGWRLGVIMLNQRNVIDDMIENVINLNEKKKAVLDQRYRIDSETPQQIRFIDRLCLDSRDVALGHTAGIACPGQIIMALFALYNLIHQQTYKPAIKNILDERIKYLYKELKLTYSETPHDTHYYALLNILELAENKYDKNFAMYLLKYYYPVDFVFCFAINTASVCLPGYGFFEPEKITEDEITPQDRNNWSIRVSLANLETDRYLILSKNIMKVLADYHKQYKEDKKKKSR